MKALHDSALVPWDREPERGHLGRFDCSTTSTVGIIPSPIVPSTVEAGGTPARRFMGSTPMRPLSKDLLEFIRLLQAESVEYVQNKRAANRDKDLADIRLLEQTRPQGNR